MQTIYTDNGAERGLRTRLFRATANGQGVEWTFAVDHAQDGERCRWYGFGSQPGATVADLIRAGMPLTKKTKVPA